MATRDSSGVEQRRARQDGNRPRTHPKHFGRKATEVRPRSAERDDCPKNGDALDSDVLGHLSGTLTGWRRSPPDGADHYARATRGARSGTPSRRGGLTHPCS
jgi:hypothetical protein